MDVNQIDGFQAAPVASALVYLSVQDLMVISNGGSLCTNQDLKSKCH